MEKSQRKKKIKNQINIKIHFYHHFVFSPFLLGPPSSCRQLSKSPQKLGQVIQISIKKNKK